MDKIFFYELAASSIKKEPLYIKEEPLYIKEEPLYIKEEPLYIIQEPSSSTDACVDETIIVKQEPDSSSTDDEKGQTSSSCPKIIHDSKRKVMRSQARELIAIVYQHMKKEALHGVVNVKDARWRTSQATGVSEKTVTRILKEKKEADETGQPIKSPHRNKKPRKCLRRDIEEKDKAVIKDTISTYESEHDRPPTLNSLKKALQKRIGFNGCIETLRRVLADIGYEFKGTKDDNSSRNKVLVAKC